MNFGQALEKVKKGKKVIRRGWIANKSWNDEDMFIYYQPDTIITKEKARNEILAEIESPIIIHGHIDMKTANGSILIGWTPDQLDMLAEDWFVVN